MYRINRNLLSIIKHVNTKYNQIRSMGGVGLPESYFEIARHGLYILRNTEFQRHLKINEKLQNTDVKILVLPIVAESGVFNDIHLSNLIKCLNAIEKELDKTEKQIAIECEFDISSIATLLSELNPDYFGINFDMGNSASLGHNPEDELSVCNGRILNIHIKDRLLGGHTVKLGTGNVDFKKIAKLLSDQGYDGNMILQAARDFQSNETELIASYIDFCRKFDWVVE